VNGVDKPRNCVVPAPDKTFPRIRGPGNNRNNPNRSSSFQTISLITSFRISPRLLIHSISHSFSRLKPLRHLICASDLTYQACTQNSRSRNICSHAEQSESLLYKLGLWDLWNSQSLPRFPLITKCLDIFSGLYSDAMRASLAIMMSNSFRFIFIMRFYPSEFSKFYKNSGGYLGVLDIF
jgi:hypothetical protein